MAPDVLAQVRARILGFAEAVRMGVTCEPPKGVPAMEPLIEALRGLGTDLFAIVEQDMYPCDPDVPFPVAGRTAHSSTVAASECRCARQPEAVHVRAEGPRRRNVLSSRSRVKQGDNQLTLEVALR